MKQRLCWQLNRSECERRINRLVNWDTPRSSLGEMTSKNISSSKSTILRTERHKQSRQHKHSCSTREWIRALALELMDLCANPSYSYTA